MVPATGTSLKMTLGSSRLQKEANPYPDSCFCHGGPGRLNGLAQNHLCIRQVTGTSPDRQLRRTAEHERYLGYVRRAQARHNVLRDEGKPRAGGSVVKAVGVHGRTVRAAPQGTIRGAVHHVQGIERSKRVEGRHGRVPVQESGYVLLTVAANGPKLPTRALS